MTRTLDWKRSTDPRNLNYPFRLMTPNRPPRVHREWNPGPVLDQGQDGACVGFGWTAELLASPNRVRLPWAEESARNLYHAAQTEDEWQGENYEGTSVNAGAIIARRWGYITGWRWATTVDDIVDALLINGPVVLGIPWLTAMFTPRAGALLEASGNIAGGHCILLTGYHPAMTLPGWPKGRRHEVVRLRNSWGPTWGRNGNALIRLTDLATLLPQGEAAIPLGRTTKPATTTP